MAWSLSILTEPLDWAGVLRALAFMEELAACPQDTEYHAEGDVLTHTRMVCEALMGLDGWRALGEPDRSVVFLAALLHDVGKPRCTEADAAGRVTSAGHSMKGMHVARARVYRGDPTALAAPFGVRERVAGLVRHHGLPLAVLEKEDPRRAVLTASMTARCDHLALLAEADARGRRCRSAAAQAQLLEKVGLFRELAAEYGCAEGPRAFETEHARFTYFADGRSGPDYVPFDDTRCEAVVMCGLPGAGKDTLVRGRFAGLSVVSLDAVREALGVDPGDEQGAVVAAAKEQARGYLRAGRPFVWNATNTTRMMRRQVVSLLTGYGARVRIVYAEAPYAELVARNAGVRVPRPVVERLIDRLDVPDATEAHAVEYHLGDGGA